MSYCRWSSDDFNCDIYAYSDVNGGYSIHVAGRRYKEGVKRATLGGITDIGTYVHLSDEEMVDIGLPSDGQSYNESTLQAFKDRLLTLRGEGYRFPNHVLDTIDEEIKESDHA